MIDTCKAFKATDKPTLRANDLECGLADSSKGYFLNSSGVPTQDCSECFESDETSESNTCDLCPNKFRCVEQKNSDKKEGKCESIAKKELLDNCETYEKTDTADSDPKCQKCGLGFGVGQEQGKCHNCCEESCYFKSKDQKVSQDGVAVKSINGGDRVKCEVTETSKKRILNLTHRKPENPRRLATSKAKIVELKDSEKLAGCRQYKQFTKNKDTDETSTLKCQVCWKDFQLSGGECSLECDKKSDKASQKCKYENDSGADVTNEFYCLQEKEAQTGVCMPIQKVDAECSVYKTSSEKDVDPKCEKCTEGNVLVGDDCVKKCNKESACPMREWCLVSDEANKDGGCSKSEILNCKEWKNGVEEEKCEACIDGFKLNSEGSECKADGGKDEGSTGRRLVLQIGRFDRIFEVNGGSA